ncbi:MAG: hypothetical protein CL846_04340 [Crocinitomicaceae bacterium]|nr:hypothetical protein [Crocinitomicaceae bacterium]|tara:strand:+ start:1832 stop:3109 length:1278 start_codon:yes stop_codon:yes gene_type:complete
MKKTILICLSLFFISSAFTQNKPKVELHENIIHPVFSTKQFISYTIPIALKTTTDMFGKINGENMQINAEKLQKLENERLTENERLKLVKTVFEKVRTGEVTAYDCNPINGLFNMDPGMSNFNAMALERKEDGSFYEPHLQYAYSEVKIDEYGEPEYDDNGNPITIDIYIDYKPEDVTSITFYENWSFDVNNETGEFTPIQKQVIGYTLNVPFENPESGEIEGIKDLIYIPCAKEANEAKMTTIKENICTSTRINMPWHIFRRKNEETIENNWYSNNLSADFRFHFCQELIYLAEDSKRHLRFWKVKGIYDAGWGYNPDKDGFPFSKELSNEDIKKNSSFKIFRDSLDENDYPVYDSNGYNIRLEFMVPYSVDEIIALGFVEDWLFDEKTLSIQKRVKGLMPTVFARNPESEEIEGLIPFFCIKY